MAIDAFSIQTLNRLVEDRRAPSSFLADTFFPDVELSDQEEIYFDDVSKKRRLAPLVSPLAEGQVVDMPGHKVKSFRPAYVKDKRVFDPTMKMRRRPGERIGGTLSPTERLEQAIQAGIQDQLEMLTRREEWMASSALRLGSITVVGEKYPSTVVNFGRPAGHTVALTSTARWGENGVSPLDSLNTWLGTIQGNGGGSAKVVVMDPLAWGLFAKDSEVKDALKLQAAYRTPTLNSEPMSSFDEDSEADVVYHGKLGVYEIWQYQSTYQDEAGAEQKMIPDYTVIMGSPGRLMGTRCYGMLKEMKVLRPQRFFAKSWEVEDPSVRYMLMVSAPLVVPFRPAASFCATVR